MSLVIVPMLEIRVYNWFDVYIAMYICSTYFVFLDDKRIMTMNMHSGGWVDWDNGLQIKSVISSRWMLGVGYLIFNVSLSCNFSRIQACVDMCH